MTPIDPSRPTDQHAYLYAHTRLPDYLKFITDETLEHDEHANIVEKWRTAAVRFRELQSTEGGIADKLPVGSLPKELEPFVRQVAADPIFKRSFAAVPGAMGMVELDRLVVSQKTVNLTHVRRICEELGPSPKLDAILRTCMPIDHPTPPVRLARIGKDSFVFASDSNDLRFLESLVIRPEQLSDYESFGPLAGLAGVAVGYGSNYLNAVALERRLVLNNGFHRAYALRSLGISQVPCVVQKLSSREELQTVGRAALRRDPEIYFDFARPPVLKDFFDPILCRSVARARTRRYVRVTFSIEELDMP